MAHQLIQVSGDATTRTATSLEWTGLTIAVDTSITSGAGIQITRLFINSAGQFGLGQTVMEFSGRGLSSQAFNNGRVYLSTSPIVLMTGDSPPAVNFQPTGSSQFTATGATRTIVNDYNDGSIPTLYILIWDGAGDNPFEISNTVFPRDSTKDITFTESTSLRSAAASDGITLWFIGGDDNIALAYNAATRARDSSKDINIESSINQDSMLSDGTTIWFVGDSTTTAFAYNAATRARDSSKDISLGRGIWEASTSDGTTLWFLETGSSNAVAYNAATRARDSSKDIDLGSSRTNWKAAASDGTTLWFVNDNINVAVAYTAATLTRDPSKYISLESGNWNSAASDGDTVWFVKLFGREAIAYSSSPPAISNQLSFGTLPFTAIDFGSTPVKVVSYGETVLWRAPSAPPPTPTGVIPSWNDDTGDAFTATIGTAISAITVPAVDAGTPAPTYAASGLPAGITFNPSTRVLSGTPSGSASRGTITVTATNASGSDTWTVAYTISAAVSNNNHSYSITSGARSGITGYWDANIGSITDANYTTPNGTSVRIRQSMVVSSNFRFLINGSGIGSGSADQFPTEIRLTYNGAESVWSNPGSVNVFGQGAGRDYTLTSGTNPLTASGRSIDAVAVYP